MERVIDLIKSIPGVTIESEDYQIFSISIADSYICVTMVDDTTYFTISSENPPYYECFGIKGLVNNLYDVTCTLASFSDFNGINIYLSSLSVPIGVNSRNLRRRHSHIHNLTLNILRI